MTPLFVTELLKKNEQHYELRTSSQFTILPIRTVYHESERKSHS